MRMLSRAALLTAFVFLASWPIQAADSLESYYGIWKGEMHTSGAKVTTIDAKIVVCFGPKYKTHGGKQRYGWMNRHSGSFGAVRDTVISVTGISPANGGVKLDLTLTTGMQYFTLKSGGRGKLTGTSDFKSSTGTADIDTKGNVDLVYVGSVGKHCPNPKKWPAS